MVILLIAFRLMRLMCTAREPANIDIGEAMERAAPIINQSARCAANLALTGDKEFLFHPSGDVFIMYRTSGRSAIAMGDAIGNPAHLTETVWQYEVASFFAATQGDI